MRVFLLFAVLLLGSLGLSQTDPANLPQIPVQPSAPNTQPAAPRASKTAAAIRARGRLILAIDPQFAPFALRDAKNKLVGFDVDLARFVAERLGVLLEVQSVGFNGLLNALKTARADLAGSGLQPEKRKDVLYSKVYFDNAQVFVVRAGNPTQFAYPASNLNAKQIGVRANTIGFLAASLQLVPLGARLQVFDSNKKALEALQTSKIESLLLDLPTFEAYRRRKVPIDRLEGIFVQEKYVYALPAHSDLVALLNTSIGVWQKNGGYQKALEKWLLDR
ncbi:MAG: transporter substrate-binding domain-containing protein [Deinococcales bacterium]